MGITEVNRGVNIKAPARASASVSQSIDRLRRRRRLANPRRYN